MLCALGRNCRIALRRSLLRRQRAKRADCREAKKPSLSLKITPPVGFAPLKTRLVVDVRNGDDDFADFYCPTVEWDWGDGTVSANSEDCDP